MTNNNFDNFVRIVCKNCESEFYQDKTQNSIICLDCTRKLKIGEKK